MSDIRIGCGCLVVCPLHAAAPELLQALEYLLDFVPEYHTNHASARSRYCPWCTATAAIAKAKGEKP